MTGRTAEAAALTFGAMALFGLIDNFMGRLAETAGLWQFQATRTAIALLVLVPLALALGWRLRPRRPRAVMLRSLVSSVGMVIYFGCLGLMPIAQVAAGFFTAPLFVVLYASLWGERVGARRLLAVALGFLGVVLALGLRPGEVTALALLPVLAGALYGLGSLLTQRLCAREPTGAVLLAFFGFMGAWGVLGLLALGAWGPEAPPGGDGFILRGWVSPDATFWAVTGAQALVSLLGLGMVIRAYQIAEATRVAVFENALLVSATLWAVVLWGEVPGAVEWAGLALVTLAGALAVGERRAREAPA